DAGVALEARVVVGDLGQPAVADAELAGQRRLGVLGHVDDVAPRVAKPARLGSGGEAGALDHHHRARAVGDGADVARGLGQDVAELGAVGSAKLAWPRTGPSRKVSGRPHVRSISWSQTTSSPGWMSARSEPAANGPITRRTPSWRRAHRLAREFTRWGGYSWCWPWRGRKATVRSPTG